MAVTFKYSLDHLGVSAALSEARDRGLDLRPGLRSVARFNVAQTRRRFQTSRAPDGSTWKPSRKARGQTLILKGLLLRSITERPPTKNAVEWGSNRVYAGIHQTGGTIRAKTSRGLRFRVGSNGAWVSKQSVDIPTRPYLGMNRQDLEGSAAILLDHVGGPLTGEAS